MPEKVKGALNGVVGSAALATWIMGALLVVLLLLAGAILRDNSGRLERLETLTIDRGERLGNVEGRLGRIELSLDGVSGKLDGILLRR